MNFNISQKPEYNLYGSLSDELIRLYGIECLYYKVERIQKDEVFGEDLRKSLNDKNSFKIYMLPQETEMFSGDSSLSVFGLENNETLTAFISKQQMIGIHEDLIDTQGFNYDNILGNLIFFNSGKIMEITHFSYFVEGVSNLFTYGDPKNLFKVVMKTYYGNNIERTELDNPESVEVLDSLDEVFELDEKHSNELEKTIKTINKKKPLVSKDEGFNKLFGEL